MKLEKLFKIGLFLIVFLWGSYFVLTSLGSPTVGKSPGAANTAPDPVPPAQPTQTAGTATASPADANAATSAVTPSSTTPSATADATPAGAPATIIGPPVPQTTVATTAGTTDAATGTDSNGALYDAAQALNNTKVVPPEELSWLKPTASSSAQELTLKKAMDLALLNSPVVRAAEAQLEEKRQNRNLALSPLLPQIHIGPSYVQRSENESQLSQGINPQRELSINSTVTQVLFNDQLISNLFASGHTYEAQKYILEGVKLQTLQDAGLSFFTYQQAINNYHINLQNLRDIQVILGQTTERNKAGSSGDEEVDRWEAAQANAKCNVLDAYVTMANSLVNLNQTLGVSMNTDWQIKDTDLNGKNYFFLHPDILSFFHDNKNNICSRFATFFAMSNTPAIHAADEAIEAQKILLGEARRSIFMPDIEASGGYNYILSASDVTVPGEARHDTEWKATISASFPLYEGGKPVSETKLNNAMLKELWANRQSVALNVESLTDQSLYAMQGTHPGLKYTNLEVEKTKASNDIFINKYSQGNVTLEVLIGSEDSYLQAQLNESQAKYALLKNIIRFQLALGWFEAYKTPEEKEKFLHAIEFYRKAQQSVPLQTLDIQVQPATPDAKVGAPTKAR